MRVTIRNEVAPVAYLREKGEKAPYQHAVSALQKITHHALPELLLELSLRFTRLRLDVNDTSDRTEGEGDPEEELESAVDVPVHRSLLRTLLNDGLGGTCECRDVTRRVGCVEELV